MKNIAKFAVGTLMVSMLFMGTGFVQAAAPSDFNSPTGHTLESGESVTGSTRAGQTGVLAEARFDVPNRAGDQLSLITSNAELNNDEKISFRVDNNETSRTSIKVKISKNNELVQEFEVEPNNHKSSAPCSGPGEYKVVLERIDQDQCKGNLTVIGLPE